jgi:hypothetical protein
MTISRNLSILAEGVSSSGVLAVTNGGTGTTTSTGTGNVVLSASPTFTGTVTATTVTSPAATALTIQSAGTTAMTIDTSQNVGIGTSSPTNKLTISGNVNASNYYILNSATTDAGVVGFSNSNGPSLQMWGSAAAGSGAMIFTAASSERMRIDASGNVGIGTASPSTYGQLVVYGGNNQELALVQPGTGQYSGPGLLFSAKDASTNYAATYMQHYFNSASDTTDTFFAMQQRTATAGFVGTFYNYSFKTGSHIWSYANTNTERMRIDASGNVGIGTASPGSKLEVAGNGSTITDAVLRINNPNAGAYSTAILDLYSNGRSRAELYGQQDNTGLGGYLIFNTSNTGGVVNETMRIDASGNVGIGTASTGAFSSKLITNGVVVNYDSTNDVYISLNPSYSGNVAGIEAFNSTNTIKRNIAIAAYGGNVGIGTASPGYKLDVNGTINFTGLASTTKTGLQYVTPQMYGAAGDGTTDDTTALTNALNSGYPVFLYGSFKITSAITITLSQGSGLKIEGAGQQKAEILLSGASTNLTIDIQYTGNYVGNNAQVVLRDFSLVAKTASSGTSVAGSPPVGMLNLIATPTPSGGFAGITADNVLMDNVSFLGDGTGWSYVGMYLQDLRYSTFRNINMQGCIGGTSGSGGATNSCGIAFKTTNLSGSSVSNAPTALNFDVVSITGGDYGIKFIPSGYTGATYAMDPQGVWIRNCAIIGNITASVYLEASDQQNNEWHVISCSTYASTNYGVYASNAGGLRIKDCTIINGTNSSSRYCIYSTFNAASSQNNFSAGQIMDNVLVGQGSTVAIGGTVNKGTGVALSTVYVAFNSATNCGGGVAGSAYTISGTAISASNNG